MIQIRIEPLYNILTQIGQFQMDIQEEDSLSVMIEHADGPKPARQIVKDSQLKIKTEQDKLEIYLMINRVYIQNLMQRKQRPNVPVQIRSALGSNCIFYKEFQIDSKDSRVFCGLQQMIKGNIHILFNPSQHLQLKVYFKKNIKRPEDYIWMGLHYSSAGVWKSRSFTMNEYGGSYSYRIAVDEIGEYLQPNLLVNVTLKRRQVSNSEYLGIINLGNTCFMNSCLQMLFYIRPLRKIILQAKSKNPLIKALRQVFSTLMDTQEKRPVDVQMLLQSYEKYNQQPRRQQDVQQFLLDFINEIQKQCPQVKGLWQGKCSQTTYSKQKQKYYKSTISQQFAQLDVHLFDREHRFYQKIQDSLKQLMQEQLVDEMIENDEFGKIKVAKYRRFEMLPDVLFVNLKRYRWSKEKMRLSKIFSHIQYGENLNLSFLLETPGNDEVNPECDYNLFSVIVHKGTSPHNGHYFVFVNTSKVCEHPQWVSFNDSFVTKSDAEEILGFTGKKKTQIILDKTYGKFTQREIQSDASSYLLVYIRRAVFNEYQGLNIPIPRDYIKEKIKRNVIKEKESLQDVNVFAVTDFGDEPIQLFRLEEEYMVIPLLKNESIRSQLKKVARSLIGSEMKYVYRVYVNERKVKWVYPYESALDITRYRRGLESPSYVLIFSDKIPILAEKYQHEDELGIFKVSRNQLPTLDVRSFGLINADYLDLLQTVVQENGGRVNYLDSKEDFVQGWNRFVQIQILRDQ